MCRDPNPFIAKRFELPSNGGRRARRDGHSARAGMPGSTKMAMAIRVLTPLLLRCTLTGSSKGDPPMTIAHRELIDVSLARWYHCATRCFRRAVLLGDGLLNRKEWVEDRIEELALERHAMPAVARS
jgi:hypothetical protein